MILLRQVKKALLLTLILGTFSGVFGQRQIINFNKDWNFSLGDFPEAKNRRFEDKDWSKINLPHSFSLPYFMQNKVYNGYGWYRKSFNVSKNWENKALSLEFEGSFIESEIFVNGKFVGKHVGGYTGFSFDISDFVKNGENILAVRVNNLWKAHVAPRAGDHQYSGGIYRDVFLVVTDKLRIDWNGTFFSTPNCSKEKSGVSGQIELKNGYDSGKSLQITSTIFSPKGKNISSARIEEKIGANQLKTFTLKFPEVRRPQLWSPTTPNIYKAVTKIFIDGKNIDSYTTYFGFRFFDWTPDKGFFLNGEKLYLLGANVHQDRAGWGDAVTNSGFARDVKLMKNAGFNCIRGSHYPHDPAFVEACDKQGVIYFSENAFWGMGGSSGDRNSWGTPSSGCYPPNEADQDAFDESVLIQLRAMIKIHRNSPAIIAWSMSNEPFFTDASTMPRVKQLLIKATEESKKMDPTRLVAIGGCQRAGIDKLGQNQVAFYNGDGATFRNPGVPNMVSEYSSHSSDRPGTFSPLWGELGNGWDRPEWRGGQVIWCGIDHGTVGGKGLATMGLVDYFRLPKRQYYWYQEAYFKGIKEPKEPQWAKNGNPEKLLLTSDKKTIEDADGTDDVMLIVKVCDDKGVPISNNVPVTLKVISGPGEFPTGSTIEFYPPSGDEKSDIFIRDGQCAIDFRSYHAGKTVIEASSPNLQSAKIEIISKGKDKWVEGKTERVTERPYKRFSGETVNVTAANLPISFSANRPCWVSSEKGNYRKANANDNDEKTAWIADEKDEQKFWRLDMEGSYKIGKIEIIFPDKALYQYDIKVSEDNKTWQTIIKQRGNAKSEKSAVFSPKKDDMVRFVQIDFHSKNAGIAEIKIEN